MQSLESMWNMILDDVKNSDISEVSYNCFINPIFAVSFDGETLVLGVDSDFQRGLVSAELWFNRVRVSIQNVLGFLPEIKIVTKEQGAVPENQPIAQGAQFTFENFVSGSSNRFAYSAALAVAQSPGGNFNPLFIHGNSGLGKTHLLWAIHNEIKAKHPEMKLICVRGEEFTNELISSIEHDSMDFFHEKYRSADVLFIDDIHFIAGKEATQEEFFNTFNILYQERKQIVLTSDRPPKDIQSLDERIRTRLVMGLLADVSPPDFDTKMAIIHLKAKQLGFVIPDDVAAYIAHQIKSNVRQIEGTVKKLFANFQLTGEKPSTVVAQKAIADIRTDDAPTPVTVDRIMGEVARTYNLTVADITSKNQSKNISHARKIAMYIIREITDLPIMDIGRIFDKDHSTVVYALKSVNNALDKNQFERATVNDIIKNISNN